MNHLFRILGLFFLLIVARPAKGQLFDFPVNGGWVPQAIFKADMDGRGGISDVVVDESGDLIVSGSFSDTLRIAGMEEEWVSRGVSDLFVMRMTADFDIKWLITAGGLSEEFCIPAFAAAPDHVSVTRLHDDALYVAGRFLHEADFDNDGIADIVGSSDECNYFLAKYNLQGQFLWAASSSRLYTDIVSGLVVSPPGLYWSLAVLMTR